MPDAATHPPDPASILAPIARALLPGWEVTIAEKPAEEMPIPGALAVCSPTPTRSLAHVDVVSPWPDGESLPETLWHEMTHALLSPLAALVEQSEGAVMVEERIVEQLGKLLATLPARARGAVARAVERWAPRMRARISARAPLARGASMDGKQVLAAIAGQDEAAALKILNDWAAEQLAAAGHPGAAEPDGDEAAEMAKPEGDAPMAETPKPAPAPPIGAPKPAESPRVAARLVEIDGQHLRARKAADAAVGITVRARLRELRTEGIALPTNLETELVKMTDLDRFEQRVADITAGRSLAMPAGQRARAAAPVQHGATPPPAEAGGPTVTAEQLREEGAEDGFLQMYEQADPVAKAGLLAGFRDPSAVSARARLRGKGPTGRALHAVRG